MSVYCNQEIKKKVFDYETNKKSNNRSISGLYGDVLHLM